MLLLLSAAMADPPDIGAVQALASRALGKDVPEKFLCVGPPSPDGGKLGDAVAVGVKVKNTGCQLKGVIVAGTWYDTDKALIAAVPGWPGMNDQARAEVAVTWAREIVFAWDQPIAPLEWSAGAVTTRVAYRIPKPQHASESDSRVTFDAAGLVKREDSNTSSFHTDMTIRMHSTKTLTEEQVLAGLQAKGLLLEECIRAAWTLDLTAAGRTRLAWDIVDGKATNVTARGWGETPLLECYSGALHRMAFEGTGAADVTIAMVRNPVAN